ncbi:MAG: hypothetical protein RL078_1523 [Bacteroidota bacterium]|jgi:hypothetical protein
MKHIFTLLFAFVSLSFWGQTLETDLRKSYSKEEINQFSLDQTLPIYEYALTHACYLTPLPEGKDVSGFASINLAQKGKDEPIKFTDLGLRILDRTQYFKVADSPYLLVVKSINVLKIDMQNQK